MSPTVSRLAPLAVIFRLGCMSDEFGVTPTCTPNLQCTILASSLFDGGVGRDGNPSLTTHPTDSIGSTNYPDTRIATP